MPEIFPFNSSDATVIQQHYEQIIETLLRRLLDIKQSADRTRQNLKIFDEGKLVYGFQDNQWSDKVSGISGKLLYPQLIHQLEQLRSTPVGSVVEGANNKKIELDGKVILESDRTGIVIVNKFLQSASVQNHNQYQNQNQLSTTSVNHQEPVKETSTELPVPGSTRVQESLQVLEDSPIKTILGKEIEQLRLDIQALQQERILYKELIEQRLQQPQNTSWWQQAVNNVSTVFKSVNSAVKMGIREFKENSAQYKIATSLKTLFHLQTQPGTDRYTAGEYQISRSGSVYDVKSSITGKQIMQFRSTPLGIKVEKDNLDNKNIQEISNLRYSMQRNEPLPTIFTPVGEQEAQYLIRVQIITDALVQYATAHDREVEVDGVLSYKWKANPDGTVHIEAKDGRGTLVEKEGGKLKSNMSQKDLVYFEQILPSLQPTQQSSISSPSRKTGGFELG